MKSSQALNGLIGVVGPAQSRSLPGKAFSLIVEKQLTQLVECNHGSLKDCTIVPNPHPPDNVRCFLPYTAGTSPTGLGQVGQERRRVRAPSGQDISSRR